MLQVVQDAEEEDEVERAEARLRQVEEIDDAVIHLRLQPAMDELEVRDFDAIDGRDGGPAPLRLETEPAVPGADVEHAAPGEVRRNGEAPPPRVQDFECIVALQPCAVGKLKAVIPAL